MSPEASSPSPRSPRSTSKSSAPLTDELRSLFDRSEHDSVVLRIEQLLKRKRTDTPLTRLILETARAFSLIHVGRSSEALPLLRSLSQHPEAHRFRHAFAYAICYAQWATGGGSQEAISELQDSEDDRKLKAQLWYRGGEYGKAAEVYEALLSKTRAELEDRSKPVSRWTLASVTGRKDSPVLTASELEHYRAVENELATNCAAALVLNSKPERVVQVVSGLANSYELQYNSACASIARADFEAAEIALEKAEALVRADLDDEEDDIEEALAPVRVQRAYLGHLGGNIAEAERVYKGVTLDRKADAATLAVAANNLTVALGQLAFGKGGIVEGGGLPKGQHEALVEGLKKMRATSGKNVERKLTVNQRGAMARNRAILLVQMGRYDACRGELTRLKGEFPRDPLVPLIEASLIAKRGNLETADKILASAGDGDVVRAARVQLAASNGERERAAKLLGELFPGRPAAVMTAAALLEENGNVEGALNLLKDLASKSNGDGLISVKKVLSGVLLRNGKYEEGAKVLREICNGCPADVVSQAQLVVATSYFDAKEAERGALLLPTTTPGRVEVDAEQLESLPPPKRRDIAARLHAGENGTNEANDLAAREAAKRERKKKKRKKRLPKNYDPNGPPPDPERWLPKTLRSGYKKKKTKENNFRGSQGADAAAAEAAAQKNAERSAARAAERDAGLPPTGRGKHQRKKKTRR